MKLPIPIQTFLHGKAVEWERLESKKLDMTEGRSTGIPKILHAMETNGSPPPVFDFDEDHSFFMVRLPVHPQATMPEGLTGQVSGNQRASRDKGTSHGGDQLGVYDGVHDGAHDLQLTKVMKKILGALNQL